MSAQDPGFLAALEEARTGAAEGGIPIGACLVAADGKILGRGHNMRVQNGSAVLHVRLSSSLLLSTRDHSCRDEQTHDRNTKERRCLKLGQRESRLT